MSNWSKWNRDDLRNSKEPYCVEYHRGGFSEALLRRHIDSYTLAYKHWHINSLKETKLEKEIWEFINKSDNVSYALTIRWEHKCLKVSCGCDRRVEKLCHHAFYALIRLIPQLNRNLFNQ